MTMRNPFQYNLPVEPANFAGRWQLVREMALTLTIDNGDSFGLIAGRRCGKSSLLRALAHQLRAEPEGDWLPLVVSFDFKREPRSVEHFFAQILENVTRLVDQNARRRPKDAWPNPIELTQDWLVELADADELELSDFEDCICHILDRISTPHQPVRLILLLDEVDEMVGKAWCETLFNQLRALIYSSTLGSQVRLALTGSHRFLEQVSQRGSPLWNVLKLEHLHAFDRDGFNGLVQPVPTLPDEVNETVWRLSGGHPFLAQYLLKALWDDHVQNDFVDATAQAVEPILAKFQSVEVEHLNGWVHGVEHEGLLAYGVLAQSTDWVAEGEVLGAISDPTLDIKRGLTALCYHGLAVHRDYTHYRAAGELFRRWYSKEKERLLTNSQPETENENGQPVHIHANTYVAGDHIGQDKVGQDKVGGDKTSATIGDSNSDISVGKDIDQTSK